MSLDLSVREICVGLTSVRATERKKSAETLKDMLSRNAIPSLLNENTFKKFGYNWNHVFNDINDYILKESEKLETNKNFNVIVGISTSLLNLCVSGSIKGGAYIKCDSILEACLNIFNDSRLRKAIGDAYFSVLYKHVLDNEYYIGFITPSMWENLLDAVLTLCQTHKSDLDSLTRFRLLWLVIKNAYSSTQFCDCLRDALPDIQKCFQKVMNEKKVQEFVMKIVLIMLEQLSTEYRLLMCEFSESILPIVFKFYDHSLEYKKKSLLFKVLQLAIAIHHPLGKLQNEEGSMAHEWNTWRKQMHSILEIVCLEISHSQKLLKQNNSQNICDIFSRLAAATYYQIFHINFTELGEGESSAKKPKLNFNKNKMFTDLLEELKQNHEPWVGIIEQYVQNFGDTLTENDYLCIIKISEVLINMSSKFLNWDSLGKLSCSAIQYFIQNRSSLTNEKYDIFVALFNTCVRNAAIPNTAHKPIHKIICSILRLDILKYSQVQSLLVLYFEKGMPANDTSITTLESIYTKFYSQCCYLEQRMKCLNWLKNIKISDINVVVLKNLFIRLIANENILLPHHKQRAANSIYEVLFQNMEENILFGCFEYDITSNAAKESPEQVLYAIEENQEIISLVTEQLQNKFSEFPPYATCADNLVEKTKHAHLVLHLYESLQKWKFISKENLVNSQLYFVLISSLKDILVSLRKLLGSDEQFKNKVRVLKCLQALLEDDYGDFLNGIVRACVEENCFHAINGILKTEPDREDGDNNCDEDVELGLTGLKHQCVYFLAAYCSKKNNYADELVKCILDEDLYNFEFQYDVDCALRSIEMIIGQDKEDEYLDSVFGLLKTMCKYLFRNSKASLGILRILLKIIDRIWLKKDNVTKRNCIIMVKGYYERCNKLFYPPNVAVLIYECAARLYDLNRKYDADIDDTFTDFSLVKQMKGDSHNIRIYCCYLFKYLYTNINEDDLKKVSESLHDIFVINITTGKENTLKDETNNRTLTVLHCFVALSKIEPSIFHSIMFELIHMQQRKSFNVHLTRKVLNILTKNIAKCTLDEYVNNNIKDILFYWFQESEKFEDLPLQVLGFKSVESFLEKHVKWLVASEILWRCKGHIDISDVLKTVVAKSKKTPEDIIEMSFCSMIALSLPYIVIEKYKLEAEKHSNFNRLLENSNRMFQSTRQILTNDKWSNLFVEHMGDLILLGSMHVSDSKNAIIDFSLDQLRAKKNTFVYSKNVFKAILRYFGELIDGNVMEYLCENQPLVILNILFKLWGNFVNEKIVEFRILHVHTYVSFIENIPTGFQSDIVLFSFALNTLVNAINVSQSQRELIVLVHALKYIIERVLTQKSSHIESLQNSIIAKVLSILSTKKENKLIGLLKSVRSGGEDEIDFIDLVYKNEIAEQQCLSSKEFENMLETYITNLIYPSEEILSNLRRFLKNNIENVNKLCKDLSIKGFSEDCLKSNVHRVINSLNNVLKSCNDDKIRIEVCNCLSEIATYDIKTLVTIPPDNTEKIASYAPKQYFAYSILKNLSTELFDEDPSINSKVTKVINRVLKYRDGKLALDMDGVNREILQPLSPSNCEIFAEYELDNQKLATYSVTDFWVPKPKEDHSTWAVRITTALLNIIAPGNNCTASLSAVCAMKPSLSAKLMPSILGLLFDSDNRSKAEKLIQLVGEQINQFFSHVWEMTFDDKLENSEDGSSIRGSSKLDHNYKIIIQYILGLINFIRLQAKTYKIKKPLSLNYLNLDYNKVAWASALADLNLVAIYYGELWAAAQNGGVPPCSPDATSLLDGGGHLQRIFRGCFVSIGELDAVEGCGTAHLTSEEEKRKYLINTGQYTDALLLHDIALSGGLDRTLQYGAVTSLHKAGMHHLALQYIKSCPESEDLNDIKYDCLSILGDWSDFVDTRELEKKSKLTSCNLNSIAKKFMYACLKDCLNIQPKEDIYTKLEKPLNGAKLAIARLSQNLNMENAQCVYKIMACLHLFKDIEDYFDVRCGKQHITSLINRWDIDKLPPFRDFKHVEGLISQRSLILQHAAENNGLYSSEINCLQLKYAELGLSNERVQMAQRIVAMVKRFQPSKEVTLLESKVSWEKGHKDIALSLLHDNLADEEENVILTAMSLRQYGLWMAVCKRENARDIINKYLEKSLDVIKDCDDVDTRLKVYYDIAQFADAEYKQVVAYMNSTAFENKVKCMESMKGTAATLKSSQATLTRDEKRALIANNAFKELDEAEIANTKAEKDSFLNLAMRYYLLSLKQSEENNLSVFRVISLWFDNTGLDFNSGLGELLQSIPSWKFVTVLPQIAPRLSMEDTPFARHLRNIIIRCAIEHPQHTLPILFNLKNSDKDKNYVKVPAKSRTPPEPRVTAASDLISRLATDNPVLAVLINQMDQVCDAIIGFAYMVPASKEIGKPLAIPPEEPIHKLRDLDCIPVPIDTIAVRKNCDYSKISSLSAFESYYELVGGINYPKKISCRSSDGRSRILLIKALNSLLYGSSHYKTETTITGEGEDDMRQDAVMQQVFTIVNTLLEKNPVTYHNKLLIRTYKVVAMSRRSGVLEWCAGTMPLGTYLTHAHTRYRPQDITPSIARNKMKECHENRRSNKHKLAVFNEILKHFKPVFHYFFTEHYLDPVTWYERRLAYTRSVATSSMVGYIMGLGDRHVQNILIDKTTAEVIHIDFGIAFDQGKTLPTPETVPFRLTQDIIAGFGCSGVEGIFRRCCENTLQLLRDNQETLLTILEVLLCDPLYLWIVPNAAKNSNDSRSESGGLAARALLAVRSKLSGAEGAGAGVSVRGQVAALLHRATDRANLCRLFHGWQPYL